MKNMLLVLLAVVLAFAGCSKKVDGGSAVAGDPVASATEAGTPGAPVELRALIGSWNTMASNDESRKSYYETALLAWAEENPDVFVEIEGIPGGQTAQAMTKLITAALAGNPHDFANIDSQWVGNFHEAGVLQPIDDYIDAADKAQFFDFTKSVTERNGKLYSLWAETGILLYYYDTDLVDKAPATWDDIYALAAKLKADGSDVVPFLTQGKGAAGAFCMLPFFWSQDAILFDPADSYRPVFGEGGNRDAMVNALSFIKGIVDDGIATPELVGYEHKELQAEALAGNVASFIAGSWVNGALGDDWKYSTLPVPAGGSASNITGGWTFSFLAKDAKNLEESVDFVQAVFTGKNAMADRLPRHGYIPTRKDVFDSPAFDTPFYDEIFRNLEVASARPATSLYPEVESLIEEAIGKVVAGGDPATIVDQMYEKVLNRYNDM